jgi:Symplekin tight junction protein C terminal
VNPPSRGPHPELILLRAAIDICFSLTELFPSEIFAVAMQQMVDNSTLPVLFMRTVCALGASFFRSFLNLDALGHTNCENVQDVDPVCGREPDVPAHPEEDLDPRPAVGWIYVVRKDHRPGVVCCITPVAA